MTHPDADPPESSEFAPHDGGSGKAGGRDASKERSPKGGAAEEPMSSLARTRISRQPQRARMSQTTSRSTPDRALQDLWVARLRSGCTETLREVIAAFSDRITAVVSGILRDKDAVEDVVQETFTKAFYRIRSFRGTSSLYTWLYRVAVNATKDYIKSRKRRPAGSLDELPTPAAAMPASVEAPIEGIERRELRLRVRAAIDKLPEKFRTVLALREIEGMPYHDIASVLNLSLGTVESRLFRARRRLRTLLAQDPVLGEQRGSSDDTASRGRKGTT
jgi:RNA polymerase sigma-70 factor (ECF subfamily)